MNITTLIRALAVFLCIGVAAPNAHAQTGDRFLIAVGDDQPALAGVIETARRTGEFEHFLRAARAAGMERELRRGGVTVFAPTDEAFRRMGEPAFQRLLQPAQRAELRAMLARHIVRERITTQSLGSGVTRVSASNGEQLTLDARDGLRVNDRLVVIPDLEASNGVVQGLNVVLGAPVAVAAN